MKHIARKRFGQHFLSDGGIIDAIVREIAPAPGQTMVEIGPGLAALTQPLVERLGKLTVIELDRDLARRLREHPQLRVVESDVLKVDFGALAREILPAGSTQKLRVVGNLPYNISSPILFHLLDHVQAIEDQHFMLQKEVIDRMVARPSTAAYGRLSVMLQWRYEMEDILFVPPEAFDPPPRVESSVMRMRPLATPRVRDAASLERLLAVAERAGTILALEGSVKSVLRTTAQVIELLSWPVRIRGVVLRFLRRSVEAARGGAIPATMRAWHHAATFAPRALRACSGVIVPLSTCCARCTWSATISARFSSIVARMKLRAGTRPPPNSWMIATSRSEGAARARRSTFARTRAFLECLPRSAALGLSARMPTRTVLPPDSSRTRASISRAFTGRPP